MRIAQIVGTVTLSRIHPSIAGASLKMAVPLALSDLIKSPQLGAEDLVVYDELGAGVGDRIMLSEGGEAAQPFLPESKPVDAYNAGILDNISLSPSLVDDLETD